MSRHRGRRSGNYLGDFWPGYRRRGEWPKEVPTLIRLFCDEPQCGGKCIPPPLHEGWWPVEYVREVLDKAYPPSPEVHGE